MCSGVRQAIGIERIAMITDNYCVLTPAYGRDYTRGKECIADFLAGRDFQMNDIRYGSAYCSVRDFSAGVKVNLRYARNSKVTVVTVK